MKPFRLITESELLQWREDAVAMRKVARSTWIWDLEVCDLVVSLVDEVLRLRNQKRR